MAQATGETNWHIYIYILVTDVPKAFNKVCHSFLTHKLQYYGITGQVNTWIQSWQTDVVVGASSGFVCVELGAPQGSVLNPFLFSCYINSLRKDLSSTARLFADDAHTLCHKDITAAQEQAALQQDLERCAD